MTTTVTPVSHETWCNAHNEGETDHPDDSWCAHHVHLREGSDYALWLADDPHYGPTAVPYLNLPETFTPAELRESAQMFATAADMLDRILEERQR